jgi:hypothetical protein
MRAKRDLVRIRIEISKHVRQQTCARLHVYINLLDEKPWSYCVNSHKLAAVDRFPGVTRLCHRCRILGLPGDPASALSLHEAALGPGPTPALERPWRRVSTSWHVSLVS